MCVYMSLHMQILHYTLLTKQLGHGTQAFFVYTDNLYFFNSKVYIFDAILPD